MSLQPRDIGDVTETEIGLSPPGEEKTVSSWSLETLSGRSSILWQSTELANQHALVVVIALPRVSIERSVIAADSVLTSKLIWLIASQSAAAAAVIIIIIFIVSTWTSAHEARERYFGWGAKIGEKQSRQSNSKYNFVQYVFFEKKNTEHWTLSLLHTCGLDSWIDE